MLTAHELYLAVRPTPTGRRRDLSGAPDSISDIRLYARQPGARRWLDEYRDAWKAGVDGGRIDAGAPFHFGYLLEVHLDRLFEIDLDDPHNTERRYHWHESQMQEHAVLAERYRDGGVSRLLDGNDLAVLRQAAERWLAAPAPDPGDDAIDGPLAQVLRALINAGKLG